MTNMISIEHNEIFDLAYRFVTETSENIFLTGNAGTGKTTFLKYLKEKCSKNIIVAAPTGVAAINAGGVTVSYFEWLKNLSPVRFGRMQRRLEEKNQTNFIKLVEDLTGKKVSKSRIER